jgi:hypothetical protein
MAGSSRPFLAHRLVTAATALMPSSRRDWGLAISAELAGSASRAERTRLALAAARIVVLIPLGLSAGLRDYARAAGRSAVLALIAYLPIGLAIYLFSVVLPAARVTVPAVLHYGYPLLVLLIAGARARRASTRSGTPVVAGLTAGLVLAVLAVGTVAAMDHAFLAVISQQPDNMAKLRASGLTSMRAYLNGHLEAVAPVVIIILVMAGAIFGSLGPVFARILTPATAAGRRA